MSRLRTTLPTALRPGQRWFLSSQAMSLERVALRLSTRSRLRSTVGSPTLARLSGSSRMSFTS